MQTAPMLSQCSSRCCAAVPSRSPCAIKPHQLNQSWQCPLLHRPTARRDQVCRPLRPRKHGPVSHQRHPAAAAATESPTASALPPEEEDARFMCHALELARRGLGKTEPNPAVGCVIVKDGFVLGEGYHPKAGEPHAEVFALRAAGQAAAGATAYVTLEPCNHFGRTPPCSRALVDAGVTRVVVGAGDPNPLVGGAGIATLRKAGIDVVEGVEAPACYDINRAWMERMAVSAAAAATAAAADAAGDDGRK